MRTMSACSPGSWSWPCPPSPSTIVFVISLPDVSPKMQQTGQTGSRQTRHSQCGLLTSDHDGEWSPAERFVSGSARQCQCNKADSRCAVCSSFMPASSRPHQEIPLIKERSPPPVLDFSGSPSSESGDYSARIATESIAAREITARASG